MTSYVTPKKNVALKFYVALVDQSNTKLTKANPTIASGDFKVSTDGGAFANLATLPSANPASGRAVMIDLSAGEMNGDNIVVQCVDAAGAEWCDLVLNIQTTARQVDDLAYPATSGRSMVVDASGLVDANMVKAGPTGSGTTQTAGDIYSKVSALTFTVANQVDVNVVDWKGSAAPAMTGDAFARLGAPAGASVSADITTVINGNGVIYSAVLAAPAAIWTDTTAADFTVANSIGKSIMNGVTLGTGLTVNDITIKTGRSLAASGLDSVVVSDLAGVPTTTAKIVDALAWLFMSVRNLRTTTATQDKISNDAGAVIGTATVSDDGTTFSKGKYA